jgi:GTPase SAR1 family protein
MICFSLVSQTSLENVRNKWVPELTKHCPTVPDILVGTKSDLRDSYAQQTDEFKSRGMKAVATWKIEEMKKGIKAQAYIECSAKMQWNVSEVFEELTKVVLHLGRSNAKRDGVTWGGNCCEVS